MKKAEHMLVELKARINNLNSVQKKLFELKAKKLGSFLQVDTYFDVPKGRLKLREIEGKNHAQLIYYEREDLVKPKRSCVFILKIPKPSAFKSLIEKILRVKVQVEKEREIYRYKGTQIHLDVVKNLGTFVEFERKTSTAFLEKDKEVLERLMEKLGVSVKNLEKMSYGDMIGEKL